MHCIAVNTHRSAEHCCGTDPRASHTADLRVGSSEVARGSLVMAPETIGWLFKPVRRTAYTPRILRSARKHAWPAQAADRNRMAPSSFAIVCKSLAIRASARLALSWRAMDRSLAERREAFNGNALNSNSLARLGAERRGRNRNGAHQHSAPCREAFGSEMQCESKDSTRSAWMGRSRAEAPEDLSRAANGIASEIKGERWCGRNRILAQRFAGDRNGLHHKPTPGFSGAAFSAGPRIAEDCIGEACDRVEPKGNIMRLHRRTAL